MLRMWEQGLTDETRKSIALRVAKEVKKRGLETPAILFLEMHKPFANVAGHLAIAFSPFVMPFLGFKTVDEYSQFFSDRQNVEMLIRAIETDNPETEETS